MTEERMLRITKDFLDIIEGNEEFNGTTTIELFYEVDFESLEPAPPKDWRPICFFGTDKCIFPSSVKSRFDDSCNHCPFRKLEAKE